jgi:Na+/melibiose symporter-like transporter
MSAASPALPTAPERTTEKIFKVGTLTYSQRDLYVLFFWLMWNDFTIMLMENVNAFGKFIQIDNHATYAQIAIFGTIGGIGNIFINPFFSVWSDRTRTRWGRRRPFLLFSVPPLALCIMGIPYMPTFYHWLMKFPFMASLFQQHVSMDGAAFMVGLDIIALGIFNSMVLAIFSYLYWDVVPQEVLGRWTALSKIVTAASTVVWSIFLIGYADHHMKALCVVVSIFCLVVYLVSIWKVNEGEYPPPDKHEKGNPFAPIRAYFVECYSDPFYLWIFGAFFIAGLANASNDYKNFYLKYDLHTDYDSFGKFSGIPSILPILLGFYFGSIADKLHPVRVIAPTFFFWGLVCLGSYFFIYDKWSFLFWTCLTQVAIFANGVTYGALLPEIYPRAKLGQFCSANQLIASIGGVIVPYPVGLLFDYLHSNRFAYMFSAIFLFIGAAMFLKVYKNFEERKGRVPVPHAG